MHKLLARQLRKHFGSTEDLPEAIRPFVAAVERAYRQSDDDRAMLEHSLETVSDELEDRFLRLHEALAESRRAEDGLSRALSALTATLESTTDGILVVDKNGKILQMNQRFVELWRIPQHIQESRDDNLALEFVLGQLQDPDGFLMKVRELYGEPDAESFDVLSFKDGRIFERYSLPQKVAGETAGRVWNFRDVTARRQLEEQLRQAQKMEAVGQLAGGVAHDFNNLLTVITNYAQIVLEDQGKDGTAASELNEIKSAAERAAGLTRQLLAFSRQQLLQPRVLDLNKVSLGLTAMLQRLIGEDIRIVTNIAPKVGVVLADPGQIEQVIMNLAVNARDAMPRGGTITLETANVELGDWKMHDFGTDAPPGTYTMLAISDTGCGMDRATQARIFEPFFTTKEPGRGTGLGLATVYGIVKQSGGFVWVYSEIDQGTIFKIYLPHAGSGSIETMKAAEVAPRPRGTETILLVEDEDAVRRLASRVLTRQGYSVLEARNGAEALKLVDGRSRTIDLVLTDVVMPVINGSQLAAKARASFPDLRVIYMSGYTDDDIVRRGLLDPEMAFIQKPFTADGLARKVREVLDAA